MSKTSVRQRRTAGRMFVRVCLTLVVAWAIGAYVVHLWGGHAASDARKAPAQASATVAASPASVPAPVKPLTACDLISVAEFTKVSNFDGLTNDGLGSSGTSCSYSHPQDQSLAFVVWANLQPRNAQQNNLLFATTNDLAKANATTYGADRSTASKPLTVSELSACGAPAGQGAWITSGAYTVGLVVQTPLDGHVATIGIYAEGSLPQIEFMDLMYQTLPKAAALQVG